MARHKRLSIRQLLTVYLLLWIACLVANTIVISGLLSGVYEWIGLGQLVGARGLSLKFLFALPLMAALVWIIDYAQILRHYRAIAGLGIILPLSCLLLGEVWWRTLLASLGSFTALLMTLSTYQRTRSPGKFLLLGVGIGALALKMPSVLYLLPLIFWAQHIQRSLSTRNIAAVFLGIFIAMIVVYPLAELSILSLPSYSSWLSSLKGTLPLSQGLAPLANLLLGGIICFTSLLHNHNAHSESVRQRAAFSTIALWSAYLFLLGQFFGGASSLYVPMAFISVAIMLGRLMGYLSTSEQRPTLIALCVLTIIMFLFPL